MTGETIGSLILTLIVIAVIVAILVYILRWLYRRSTKEIAFVRTGFLGEKVVVNGGAFVIPVLHEITPVNMNVLRIAVSRAEGQALITKNRMRVDIAAEFFVRVGASREAVAAAAQTLGRRTLDEGGLSALLEGKFASAMRTVAARITLEDLHEQRGEFAEAVKALTIDALSPNGLELETVAVVDLDQTGLEFFDPSNAFDAEGLTQITEAIEGRRKARNEIEQQTLVEIRTQNLAAQRQVFEIDRDQEYARLDQEREVETRKAAQRAELARERAQRERESEEAQLTAREAIETARLTQERVVTEARITSERETQQSEIARRRAIDEAELKARELTEREQIALELALQRERINRDLEQRKLEIAREKVIEIDTLERQIALAAKAVELAHAEAEKSRSEIVESQLTEAERVAQDRALDELRVEREKRLDSLQIAKRQAFEEAELAMTEEVERARLTKERAVAEARLVNERVIRTGSVERDLTVEIAEMEKVIAVAKKSQERSTEIAAAAEFRAKAVEAEERALTTREREVAERRKLTELISTEREAQRDRLRITSKAEAEMEAAKSHAEAQKITAEAQAAAEKVAATAAAERYTVDAAGRRALNESENTLTEEARQARIREKLLDRLEGIVRESVRPMEKIDGIKILHVDGMHGEGGSRKNVTDEVIDSALRYRVQAPMIDSLMQEIGIEGGSMGRMTDVLRDAKDMTSLVEKAQGKGGDMPDDDRDRDR